MTLQGVAASAAALHGCALLARHRVVRLGGHRLPPLPPQAGWPGLGRAARSAQPLLQACPSMHGAGTAESPQGKDLDT